MLKKLKYLRLKNNKQRYSINYNHHIRSYGNIKDRFNDFIQELSIHNIK